MKTSDDSMACAAMRQPSMSRCGTVAMTWRSLNAPGSDSSALTTRYFGFALFRSMSDALRPIGKPAPPRPRSVAFCSSSMSSSEDIARARSSPAPYPPTARYSAIFVRSWSSVPPRRVVIGSATERLDDLRDVLGLDVVPVAVIDRDDGCVAAAAEALDRAKRHVPVLGRLAGLHAERLLERLDNLLRSAQAAGEVRADLDRVRADGVEIEHVVEGRDRVTEGRRDLERVGGLLERLARQVAMLLLREPQRLQRRRTRAFRIALADLLHLLVERAHRSVSPMTASSEPTTAIRSATYVSVRHVAVASRATNDGARKWTRHGFGPPSETR